MEAIREAVRRVHRNYLEGAVCPPPKITLDHYESVLEEALFERVRQRITAVETKLLAKCAAAYTAGVHSARRNQTMEACRHLGEARLIRESPELSNEARLLATTFLAAAEAYLDYRCRDYKGARRWLCESLATDQDLEINYGHKLLHVHRLHLINNLIRLEVQQGNIAASIEMAAHLIGYMQGTCQDAPAPGLWGSSHRDALPTDAIRAMFVQVMGEIGQALAGKKSPEALPEFLILENRVPNKQPSSWHPLAFQWFSTKRAFFLENTERYLDEAGAYLRPGITVAPTLWRLAALDVAVTIEDLDIPESFDLRRDILRDAMTWRGLSAGIRSVVGALSTNAAKHVPNRTSACAV